jgi:arylsulfatase
VQSLKRLNQFDDSLILFLSDNGGCAEFMAEDGWAKFYPNTTQDGRKITMGNRPDVMPGSPLSFQSYDKPWANVSNAPFRLFKHFVHEGGISTPLVAHWPNGIDKGQTFHEASHVVDILPTVLEITGSSALTELGGHAIQPSDGESLLGLFQGKSWQREQPIFWEHEGNCAIRQGQFKLVKQYGQNWELYDMETDRTELNNLAGKNKLFEKIMLTEFNHWADSIGVMPWDDALPRLLAAWELKSEDG